MSALPETRCARCGASFGCGAAVGSCWCDAVEVSGEARARLAAEYEGCLCPDCLRSSAEQVVGRRS
jgi:hypothetical protein